MPDLDLLRDVYSKLDSDLSSLNPDFNSPTQAVAHSTVAAKLLLLLKYALSEIKKTLCKGDLRQDAASYIITASMLWLLPPVLPQGLSQCQLDTVIPRLVEGDTSTFVLLVEFGFSVITVRGLFPISCLQKAFFDPLPYESFMGHCITEHWCHQRAHDVAPVRKSRLENVARVSFCINSPRRQTLQAGSTHMPWKAY